MKADKFSHANEVKFMMGKPQVYDIKKYTEKDPRQYLYLNPRNILFPEKYNGNPKEYDIAFIGLEGDDL